MGRDQRGALLKSGVVAGESGKIGIDHSVSRGRYTLHGQRWSGGGEPTTRSEGAAQPRLKAMTARPDPRLARERTTMF